MLVLTSYLFCLFYSVFFFFKQKTAYEMRISDWSSDVCSSDLVNRVVQEFDLLTKLDQNRLNRSRLPGVRFRRQLANLGFRAKAKLVESLVRLDRKSVV